MFLVSWNVAGLPTTVACIRESFGTLGNFLNLLGADILCVQEAKVSKKRLDLDAVASGAADRPGYPVEGWESFWCASVEQVGMNGVTTFVRTGLTHRVDAAPLQDDALDREGRCIATYHSHFVLFNVYVPNSRDGARQEYKAKFLLGLRRAMHRVRKESGLPVVLVGDLNLTYRTEDCHFANRRISLDSLISAVNLRLRRQSCVLENHSVTAVDKDDEEVKLCGYRFPFQPLEWSAIEELLPVLLQHISAKAASSSSSSSSSIAKSDNVTARSRPKDDEELRAMISELRHARNQLDDPEYLWASFFLQGQAAALNRRNALVYLLTECCGVPCHHPRDSEFALALLADGMIDTLIGDQGDDAAHRRHLGLSRNANAQWCNDTTVPRENGADCGTTCEPTEKTFTRLIPGVPRRKADVDEPSQAPPNPFTCWDQYRNKRYENEGNRIDYIFIDAALKHLLAQSIDNLKDEDARLAEVMLAKTLGAEDPSSSAADSSWRSSPLLSGFCGAAKWRALARVTGGGRYAAAPTDGSGLSKLLDAHKLVQFHGLPRTGFYVSPPQFSDHVGVCAVLNCVLQPRPAAVPVVDPGRVLYRRKSASLVEMFAKKPQQQQPPSSSSSENPLLVATQPTQSKRPRPDDSDQELAVERKEQRIAANERRDAAVEEVIIVDE